MHRKKRYLTQREDELLRELRRLQSGNIKQEAVDTAIEAVRQLRGVSTAFYNRGVKSAEAFMRENFGAPAECEQSDEADLTVMIDFDD